MGSKGARGRDNTEQGVRGREKRPDHLLHGPYGLGADVQESAMGWGFSTGMPIGKRSAKPMKFLQLTEIP